MNYSSKKASDSSSVMAVSIVRDEINNALSQEHQSHLKAEGFTESHIYQLAREFGFRTIPETEAEDMGFRVVDESRKNTRGYISSSGLLLPFTSDYAQLRCDQPPMRGGKQVKYLTAEGKSSKAFLPDGAKVVTEGLKDGLAGTLIGGLPTGAIAGVSHYRKALPKGGGHTILFDSDGWTNPSVFAALASAAAWTGGKIQLIPEIEGQPKAGLCEYFKAGNTPADYSALVGSAMSVKKFLIELPKHWAAADSSKFSRMMRTLFSLASQNLNASELAQIATHCKKVGKLHGMPAPPINDELKRAKTQIKSRARLARIKNRQLRAETEGLDLTEFGGDDTSSDLISTLIQVKKVVGENLKLNRLTSNIEYMGERINPNHYQLFVCGLIDQDVTEAAAIQILSVLAQKYSYHPALEYFETLSTQYGDSTIGLLDNAATRLLKTGNPLYDVFLKKTLAAIVARIYQPGCKWDYVTLLQGGQGLRKSTFWRTLMPHDSWFDDNLSGDVGSKDQLALLSRCVLQEWGEFDRITSSREAAELKSFVVRQNDVYRAPYERASIDHPRQSVIVGSVNKSEFLGDETGDRRYWVIEIPGKIDIDALIEEREQLLAAAVAAYKAGELLYLSEEDEQLSSQNNLQYRVQDPWLPQVEEWLSNSSNLLSRGVDDAFEWTTTAHILTECMGIEAKALKQYDRTRIEKILKFLGWHKVSGQTRLSNSANPQRGVWQLPLNLPKAQPTQQDAGDQDHFEYSYEVIEDPEYSPDDDDAQNWAQAMHDAPDDDVLSSLVDQIKQAYPKGSPKRKHVFSLLNPETKARVQALKH